MTVVEFLESEMQKLVYIAKSNKVKFDELFEQAKEMERKQIMNNQKGCVCGFATTQCTKSITFKSK